MKSVELLWTSDQLVAETSTGQHTTTDSVASERPQAHALDRAATGTGNKTQIAILFTFNSVRQLQYYCCNCMHVQKHWL
jgi:hypothetical protein